MQAPMPTPSDGYAAASVTASARPRQMQTRHFRSSSRSFIEGVTLDQSGAYHRPLHVNAPGEPVPPVASEQVARNAKESRRRSVDASGLARKEQEGMNNVNRWSTSSTSSVPHSSSARRSRANSGAAFGTLANHHMSPSSRERSGRPASPRASPTRGSTAKSSHRRLSSDLQREPHARSSPQKERYNPLTALPPLHTTPSLSESADDSPATNPMVATPETSTMFLTDYFGGEDSLHASKKKRPHAARNNTTPALAVPVGTAENMREPLRRARTDERDDHETHWRSAPHDNQGVKRPLTREGRELDKKSTLSRALQKAKTAVLLDNAQNIEAALEAYGDACRLLQHVMDSSTTQDDKQKLEIIQTTYTNRIAELRGLSLEQPSGLHDKSLPARPMSEDSFNVQPIINAPQLEVHTTSVARDPVESQEEVTQLRSNPEPDRTSFFTKTMQAVENSMFEDASGANFGESPHQQLPFTPMSENLSIFSPSGSSQTPQAGLTLPSSESKDSGIIPKPLALRKPSLEGLDENIGIARDAAPDPIRSDRSVPREDSNPLVSQQSQPQSQHYRGESTNSTSWLNTIDESMSDSSSVHSISSQTGLRRKHIRGISGTTDPDFDAAFDAAVEAAYDEGFEPDLDMQRRRATLERERLDASFYREHERMSSTVLPDLHAQTLPATTDEDEEEEQILDSLATEFADVRGFNFDLATKPALPRTSDSSGHSRSTWQSSHASTDRTTNTTTMSLSTVAEDGFPFTSEKPIHPGLPPVVGSPSSATHNSLNVSSPPTTSLPPLPKLPSSTTAQNASSVRSRRLSGQSNAKSLKIETSQFDTSARQRASTVHQSPVTAAVDNTLPAAHDVDMTQIPEPTSSRSAVLHTTVVVDSPPPAAADLRSAVSDSNLHPHSRTLAPLVGTEDDDDVPEIQSARPILFRKNKSSMSLRAEHTLLVSPTEFSAPPLLTPMSATFMGFQSKRNEDPRLSQRAKFSTAEVINGAIHSSGIALFDTSLSHSHRPNSPRSPPGPLSTHPPSLEPCPEPFLLRPFWLMRTLASTLTHPTGGFLTTKLFVTREVWQTRGVKLKAMEDKVANCDLLTAALGRLAGVDTYDADAIMEELQGFEEVMERVQATLTKKLGHDVGVHGVSNLFKDAPAPAPPSSTNPSGAFTSQSSDTTSGGEKTRSKEGKESKGSYLSSWRKLRNKSSGAPLSTIQARRPEDRDVPAMSSVPMTTFVPVERRGQRKDARSMFFDGPQKDYMGSLTRLFESAQVLDQIARQVEDPGLKHSSPTHVGLELSIRHAAEFFGFFVCRFVLADLGLLLDKFVKRGTEWVLA